MKNILIVGAGFSGAVIAERLSKCIDCRIDIIDERNHIAGNCYTERDLETGVMVHEYGPHIFNTDNKEVWEYINQFAEFVPYINRVKAIYKNQVYSLPINLHTINQFFGKSLNPIDAKQFILDLSEKNIQIPQNFEEQALKFIGSDLYKAFFYGYTKKQWGCEPDKLPASILKRLPVRFNYNDNYYNSSFQGIPKNGYTEIVEKMLDSPKIHISLGVKFEVNGTRKSYDHIFYTGSIDSFFNYKHGKLGYRTVYFERNVSDGDYQGNAVINYSDIEVPYTRIHEHKHFTPWEEHDKTVYFKEFSKETELSDVPYYPKRLADDLKMYEKYNIEIKNLKKCTFLGRLATYRYMDMHHVISEALEISKQYIDSL